VNFRPLLSATLEDPLRLTFPILVSPKLDGLRCIIKDGVALSRNLKPFRNAYVQSCLKDLPTGLDGELIVGEPNQGNVLGRTQSGIMSADGEPDFTFYVFDNWSSPEDGFVRRFETLSTVHHARVRVVWHKIVNSIEQFIALELETVNAGFEGVMVRGIHGKYKFGRSTHNDQILWKFKRFTDSECLVTGLEEGVSNTNPAELDALGHSKRNHQQDGMVPAGRVGTILVIDQSTGQRLRVSPGEMTAEDRAYYWQHQDKIVGQVITVKRFEYGMLNLPRFCTFKAFYK